MRVKIRTSRVSSLRIYRISIDPGVGGTGIAVWRVEDWPSACEPVKSGTVYPSGKHGSDWLTRVDTVMAGLRSILSRYPSDMVYLEMPEYYQNLRGLTAARSGSLVKLAFITGSTYLCCRSSGASVTMLTPSRWKGQLPKELTRARILARVPCLRSKKVSPHAWDAIGIGLYAKGVML